MNDVMLFQNDLFTRLSDSFGDLFNSFQLDQKSYNLFPVLNKAGYPRLNLYNTDNSTVIEATVPGLTNKDVKVDWKDDVLTINYQKCDNKEDKNKNYYFREIHQSGFSRSINVPAKEYDVENITAVVENGLLKITLPLLTPVVQSKAKQISVR